MKARQLIDGATYGPDALKVIGQAFDEAWRDIAGNFGDDPSETRLQLKPSYRWLMRTAAMSGVEKRRPASHGPGISQSPAWRNFEVKSQK